MVEDFGRYLYLPRLRSPQVLSEAVEAGLATITWNDDTFAYAEGWDEAAHRYRALRAGRHSRVDLEGEGMLVKPAVAARQIAEETARRQDEPRIEPGEADPNRRTPEPGSPTEAPPRILRRFHGSVTLDPSRVGRDAGRVAEEVIQHLTTLKGAAVIITLEIQAETTDAVPDSTVRTVGENCRTLKFITYGFEEE